MKKKFERILYILHKLDQGEKLTTKDLAKELGVAERTVYRYIKALMEADFPIYYDPDKKTYTFVEGFSLRKALLNSEEVVFLSLARRILQKHFGDKTEDYIKSIVKKCLNTEQYYSDYPLILIQEPQLKASLPLSIFREILSAIKERELLEIEYRKEDHYEIREVEPYHLFYSLGFWYLGARCRKSREYRTFALDKIKSLKRTGKYFLPDEEGIVSPEKIEEAFGPYPDESKKEVVIIAEPEVKEFFLRKKWIKDQEVEELDDGRLKVSFKVRGLKIFKHWLYSWLPFITILKPEELRKQLKLDLLESIEKHK
ncbi:MAG: transcriptional regulator [Candidatus Kryptonium sp.]